MSEKLSDRFHLDKTVNVPVLLLLGGQALLGVIYASKLDSRVSFLGESRSRSLAIADRDQVNVRLARMEEKTQSILEVVRRLDSHAIGAPAAAPRE